MEGFIVVSIIGMALIIWLIIAAKKHLQKEKKNDIHKR